MPAVEVNQTLIALSKRIRIQNKNKIRIPKQI